MEKRKLLDILEHLQSILVLSSHPVDVDSAASGLIMKKYLEAKGKTVRYIFPANIGATNLARWSFAPYLDEIEIGNPREILRENTYDATILVDNSRLGQFDSLKVADTELDLSNGGVLIDIDHHQQQPTGMLKADHYYIDDTASSCTQVIFENIIPDEDTTPQMATLGYAGLLDDTGNFNWNFSPRALMLGARLLAKGIDAERIVYSLFLQKDKGFFDSYMWIIQHMEYHPEIKSIILPIPYALFQKEHFSAEKFLEIKNVFTVHIGKYVTGYDRGFIIYELEKGLVDISFRSNESTNKINLPKMLRKLGGNSGGHYHAAGAHLDGEFEDIKKRVCSLIADEYRKNEGHV